MWSAWTCLEAGDKVPVEQGKKRCPQPVVGVGWGRMRGSCLASLEAREVVLSALVRFSGVSEWLFCLGQGFLATLTPPLSLQGHRQNLSLPHFTNKLLITLVSYYCC